MSIAENSGIENWIAKETPETAIEPELPIIVRKFIYAKRFPKIFRIVDIT